MVYDILCARMIRGKWLRVVEEEEEEGIKTLLSADLLCCTQIMISKSFARICFDFVCGSCYFFLFPSLHM